MRVMMLLVVALSFAVTGCSNSNKVVAPKDTVSPPKPGEVIGGGVPPMKTTAPGK